MVERCERCVSGLGLGFLKIVAAAVVKAFNFYILRMQWGKSLLEK